MQETSGIVDAKVHGHGVARPDGAAGTDTVDHFIVTPIATDLWVLMV